MLERLFSPIAINTLEIKNRIVYPALGMLYSYDSKLNDRYYHYFREKALGGAGIVTVGPVGVDFLGSGMLALSLADDDAIPSFKKLTSIIKENGARAWIQLFHAGAYSHPVLINNEKPLAPSPIFSKYSGTTPKEMTTQDIQEVQDAFANAARRAKEAGFDGVEIIASAGYLITQFLSPLRNQRTDQYGGSFENRVRFPKETIERTRRAIGSDYPLTIRMAGNDFVPGSNTDSETPAFAREYEKSGIDAINVTGGWHESKVPQLPMELPRGAFAYLSLNIKRAVSVPVMASNRISDPATAEKILRDGCADMINLGRVLIADPYWPQKAKEGRSDEIIPCVGCSQGCADELFSGRPVQCVGNPRAGFEGERLIIKTDSPKKVMVIGAGPAGLEAAITAAKIGHHVSIYEKDDSIGGQLRIAGALPGKKELLEFIRYYTAMLKKYDIPVHFGVCVDARRVMDEKPDHIIVAEGAQPTPPPFEAPDDAHLMSAWTVLKENPFLGKRVAVIGGGAVGLETALYAAQKGTLTPEALHFLFAYEAETIERLRELMFSGASSVTVFEMAKKAGGDVGKSTKWILFSNLKRYGVKIISSAKVCSVINGQVCFEKDGVMKTMAFDDVILASGSRPVQNMSKEIESMSIPFSVIGDGVCPGKINSAIHGGFLAALSI